MKVTIEPGSKLSEFFSVVEDLSSWGNFPEQCTWPYLAVKLAEWCDGHAERARALAAHKDIFSEYPGPATLKGFLERTFGTGIKGVQ